ncbi:MAG: hypothetical protein H7178_08000 [Chitinophagaceae bacterium]|nr:hypothetical protein [Chitinophagaceae bacterium]
MRIILILCILTCLSQSISAQAQNPSLAYSFVNVSKQDDLIFLGKISYLLDSTNPLYEGHPQKMKVEVIEVLKRNITTKDVTINTDTSNIYLFPNQFILFKPQELYVFSIKKDTILG